MTLGSCCGIHSDISGSRSAVWPPARSWSSAPRSFLGMRVAEPCPPLSSSQDKAGCPWEGTECVRNEKPRFPDAKMRFLAVEEGASRDASYQGPRACLGDFLSRMWRQLAFLFRKGHRVRHIHCPSDHPGYTRERETQKEVISRNKSEQKDTLLKMQIWQPQLPMNLQVGNIFVISLFMLRLVCVEGVFVWTSQGHPVHARRCNLPSPWKSWGDEPMVESRSGHTPKLGRQRAQAERCRKERTVVRMRAPASDSVLPPVSSLELASPRTSLSICFSSVTRGQRLLLQRGVRMTHEASKVQALSLTHSSARGHRERRLQRRWSFYLPVGRKEGQGKELAFL